MRVLELFSGTGSVGRAFEAAGWEVTSLDADLRTPADIHADILTFDCRVWHPGHFDVIWASPPCTEYSIARTTARTPRDFDLADRLVQKAIDAIIYLRPTVWWIENPATGLLRTRPVVEGLPYMLVDYCMYGAPYRKRTCLWTNVPGSIAQLQMCNRACGAFADGRHTSTAQRGPSRSLMLIGSHDRRTLDELHALPAPLCTRIVEATSAVLNGAVAQELPPALYTVLPDAEPEPGQWPIPSAWDESRHIAFPL